MSVLNDKQVVDNVLLDIDRIVNLGLNHIEKHTHDTDKDDLAFTIGYLSGVLNSIRADLDVIL